MGSFAEASAGCAALTDCRNLGDCRWFARVRVATAIRLRSPSAADRAVSDFRDPTAAPPRRRLSSPVRQPRTTKAEAAAYASARASMSGTGAEV